MNNIDIFAQSNIHFNQIDESLAKVIMEKEYPSHTLSEYLHLFNNAKDLDFSHLYFLAVLDEKLRHIVICRCLEVEQTLKTILVFDAERLGIKDVLLKEYLCADGDYVLSHYNSENIDLFDDNESRISVETLSFEQFLNIIQFGTFERFLCHFYGKYLKELYNNSFVPFECYLSSVKHLRNISAHNGLLIGSLTKKREPSSSRVAAFLGSHGIKHKTLRTNLSKQIMFDLCNLLHLCFLVLPKQKFANALSAFQNFIQLDCNRYGDLYLGNSLLVSVYSFIKSVIDIYSSLLATSSELRPNNIF